MHRRLALHGRLTEFSRQEAFHLVFSFPMKSGWPQGTDGAR